MQEITLSPLQAKQWTETKSRLILEAPAFAHVLFNMCSHGRAQTALFTRECPIAATNGRDLILNPDTYFEFTNAERVFIAVHEILHKIFNHMGSMQQWRRTGAVAYADGTRLTYDHDTMNQAMDYVINDIIVESRIGSMPPVGLHDRSIGTHMDKVQDVYRKLYEQQDGDGGGSGNKPGGFDQHLAPPTNEVRNEHEWKAAVAAGMTAAKVQGKLPGALERLFTELLDPQVDWREHIAMLLARRTGTGAVDWRRPHRRKIEDGYFAPSSRGYGCGALVVMVDLSGSIGNKEVAMFFAELGGILEDLQPERVTVLWFDHGVRRVDTLEDAGDLADIRSKPVQAGGGTCFHQPFAKVSELGLQPDAAIVLTDGWASFPSHAPNYPVIWGSIDRSPEDYPWGDVVMIPQVGGAR